MPIEALVARLVDAGFIDDQAFAAARSASLSRRGYGAHRVGLALRAAGIEPEDSADALENATESQWRAGEAFAKRRRIGPFAADAGDRDQRRKAMAAMLRAGHPGHVARAFAFAEPGVSPIPEEDDEPN